MSALLSAHSSPSFNFEKFHKDCIRFNSEIGVHLNAMLDVEGSFIKMTQPWNLSVGVVTYKQPIKLMEHNNFTRKGSFSTHFSFSMSPGKNDYGILFRLSLNGYLSKHLTRAFVAVQIDTNYDPEFGDVNHVAILVNRPAAVNRVANRYVKLELNTGKRLQCWMDYEASSKQVEVRIAKWGKKRPVDPMLCCPIDLSEMFNTQNVYLSFMSSSGFSTQICNLYSWRFESR